MKNISLDLIRATEGAAISAAKWVGSGDKELADKAATDAMRRRLNDINFACQIVIGEGIKDNSYGLFAGELLGKLADKTASSSAAESLFKKQVQISPYMKFQSYYDLAVDPIDGTRPTVDGGPGAISVIAAANEGCMYHTNKFYMMKLVGPSKYAPFLNINQNIVWNVLSVCDNLNKKPEKMTVCVLNRPRHASIIEELRKIGVRIKLIEDCDVSASIEACTKNSGVDLYYGIGGSPEGVIAAAAVKCMKGFMQAYTVNNNDLKQDSAVLNLQDIIKGNCVFVATGITDGGFLKGVKFIDGPQTNSIFMRSESGTIRTLNVNHGN